MNAMEKKQDTELINIVMEFETDEKIRVNAAKEIWFRLWGEGKVMNRLDVETA